MPTMALGILVLAMAALLPIRLAFWIMPRRS
jgi:hypothetical protein